MRVSPDLEALILSTPGVIINGGQAVRPTLSDKQHRSTAEAIAKPIRSTRQQLSARKPKELVRPGWAVEFTIPTVVVSEANNRCHWAKRYRRFKEQEGAIANVMAGSLVRIPTSQGVPLTITFTRLGGQRMDDDNLAGAFKRVRDVVAKRLGRDDGDRAITWKYEQEAGSLAGIRVRIESQPETVETNRDDQ